MQTEAPDYAHDLGDVVSFKGHEYGVSGRARRMSDLAPTYTLRPMGGSPPVPGFVTQDDLDA